MASGAERRSSFAVWWPLGFALLLTGLLVSERFLFPSELHSFTEQREMMDTIVSITLFASDEEDAAAAFESAFSRMEDVVAVASIHDPQAEAARLNEAGRIDDPSSELVEILGDAVRLSEASRGAFDVTIGPLLELWQYDPSAERQFWDLDLEEQQAAIDEAKRLVGAARIHLRENPTAIELDPGTTIDLGGIAKGYVADRGIEALLSAGIDHALIDAGGDIVVVGGKPDGSLWEISLRDPEAAAEPVARFALRDGAIATSGNYLRFYDPNREIGHIMDPRTGFSAQVASSATVIAMTCTEADALATAVFVLGPVEGLAVIDELEGVEAMVLCYDDPTEIVRSAGLDRYEIQKKDET